MSKLTAEQVADKHARRLKGAIGDMEDGINRVTVAPGKAAGAKAAKMLANLTAKVQDGTWKRRVEAVPLDEWKSKMITKGLPRVAGGIDAASGKMTDFFSQLLPAVDAAQAKVKAMPDLTIEDSINRMTAFIRDMAKFKKK